MISDFYARGFLDRGNNATFISLISKKEGADNLSDFKPVSFIGSTYKIISKCLALRLKGVLPSINYADQGAFFEVRTIIDGFLSASECVDERVCSGRLGVISKLDMEKAYDHVYWEFLYDILG